MLLIIVCTYTIARCSLVGATVYNYLLASCTLATMIVCYACQFPDHIHVVLGGSHADHCPCFTWEEGVAWLHMLSLPRTVQC